MKTANFLSRRFTNGFTVVELIIGVGIVAILSAIAIPGYLEARNYGLRSAYLNELRTHGDAFVQYASEFNSLPDTAVNSIPANMENFMPKNSTWTVGPDIGGYWAWLNMATLGNANLGGWSDYRGWIVTVSMPVSAQQIAKLDQTFDDGNGNTGILRYADAGNGTYNVYYGVN